MQKNTILFASFLLTLTQLSFAQKADSTKHVFHFGGAAKRGFPLSVMAIFNKTIETDITTSKDFVWNLSLIYSFSKQYVTK